MKWTIYRQELLLFDAKHKRLRFFYELGNRDSNGGVEDDSEFAPFRQQVQHILGSLRLVLEKSLPKGAEIAVPKYSSSETVNTFEVNLPKTLTSDTGRNIFIQYLNNCNELLIEEGLKDNSDSVEFVQCLKNHFELGNANTFDASCYLKTKDSKTTLCTSTLMHLLSSLPFLPHWDVPGVFSTKAKTKEKESVETLLSGIRQMEMPVYASQLITITDAKKHNNEVEPAQIDKQSIDLLGYEVRLKSCFSESLQAIASPIFTAEEDFYAFCHTPVGDEALMYQSCGVLYDAIQKALASAGMAEKNKVSNDTTFLYYIAYPVKTSVGRTHFWHIYLRPENTSDSKATLEQLWTSWWAFHHRFLEWPSRHAWLATELEQIDIAYAQGGMMHDILKQSNIDDASGNPINKLVCAHGHMLFPAECFCTEEVIWGYKTFECDGLTLGKAWEMSSGTEVCLSCKQCTKVDKIYFKMQKISEDETHTALLERRFYRLVKQQLTLAGQMFTVNEHKKHLEEVAKTSHKEELRRELAGARVKIANIDQATRREAINQLLVKNFNVNSTSICDDLKRICKSFLDNTRELNELENKNVDDSELQAELVLLLETDLHTLLSWYLESEPVLSLSHNLNVTECRAFLDEHSSLHNIHKGIIINLTETNLKDIPDCDENEKIKEINKVIREYKETLSKLLESIKKNLTEERISSEDIYSNGSLRSKLRCKSTEVVKILQDINNSWIFPPEEECYSKCYVESHIPLLYMWHMLSLEQLLAFVQEFDTKLHKFCFRFNLAETNQLQINQKNKMVVFYRNCLAFAYRGIDVRNFVSDENYPEAINKVVEKMNELRVGKLFVGFNSNNLISYSQITQRNLSNTEVRFWGSSNNNIQNWFEEQTKNKSCVLVIAFDGWDGS